MRPHNLAAAYNNIIHVQASRTIGAGLAFALHKSAHLKSAETAEHQELSKQKLQPPVGRSAGVPVQGLASGRSDEKPGDDRSVMHCEDQRISTPILKSRYYALVCESSEGIPGSAGGTLDIGTLRNVGGRKIGSSQITTVVEP
jgi:hypothetical protein